MNGEWCYFKSHLKKDFCDEIIKNALTIDDFVKFVEDDERSCKVREISNSDWRFAELFNVLWRTQIEANKSFFNVHVTNLKEIKFIEYGEEYSGLSRFQYRDLNWADGSKFQNKISCFINLSDSDSYLGGDFRFSDLNIHPTYSDIRLQGSLLYYPSFLEYKTDPIIRGKKYSLIAFFEGPEWR
jgi:PKHD-type hydroxylase